MLSANSNISHYCIISKIGEGGMGEVYLATDNRQLGQGGMGTVYEAKALRLNTTVALKETHFTDETLRKQFEREAQLFG